MSPPQRLAVIFDAVEERWPSMNLVAEMLLSHLQEEHSDRFESLPLRPSFFGVFERVPGLGRSSAWNADRLVTRFLTYPAQIVKRRSNFDLFHVADHSYAQLTHVLPPDRTGIFCHDLDAFAPLLRPEVAVAGWRRVMARLLLKGLQRAALVFHSTEQVRREIQAAGILDSRRLVRAPYGVAREFFGPMFEQLPPAAPRGRYVLHVGGTMARKRLDVLFRVFAEVRRQVRDLVLVQLGAHLLPEHRAMIAELGIGDAVVQPPHLARPALAALFHSAELVLVPSEREGFGIPVLEALAAGAAVVASDIPTLREVGAEAVTYCPVGEIDAWVTTVTSLLDSPGLRPSAVLRRSVAERYTWAAHAAVIADAYAALASGVRD